MTEIRQLIQVERGVEEALRNFAGHGGNGGGEVTEITAAERIDKIGNMSALGAANAANSLRLSEFRPGSTNSDHQ